MKKKLLVFGVAGLLVLFVVGIGLTSDLLDPEFSVGGEFRTLSYYISHPDLTTKGPYGKEERSYSEQRLILDPVLKLNDFVTVKMRIRALDYIWGHNTVGALIWPTMIGWNGTGTFATNQGEAGSNNFQFDRAWVQLSLGKYGSLQIGRQDTELFHNFSISSSDTYPRYHYITPVFKIGENQSIMFGILYDKRQEGNIDTSGASVGGSGGYDSFAWCPWVFYMSPKLTVGYVCFVWNTKNVGPSGQAGDWVMNDWMIDCTLGPVAVQSEWDIDCNKEIMGWRSSRDNFEFFIDAGAPLSTPIIPRVGALVAYFEGVSAYDYANSATVHGGSIGSNRDWVIEQDIDLILWNQIYNGAINNAWILRPKINFAIPNTKWGGWLSACISFADQDAKYQSIGINNTTNYPGSPDTSNPNWTYTDYSGVGHNIAGPFPDLTSGSAKTMGTEVDLGVSYTLAPRQVIELVLGVFSPGDYFAKSNQQATFGAGVKTMIRF
jgi:hypothetical protein